MAATRVASVMLAMLLAVTMLPAAGLQTAYADEPADRPATSGGDVALESTNGAPIADGTEVVDNGLRYVVRDGAATLVGFEDGATLEGVLVVSETVTDGSGTATVKAVEIAESQVAEGVTSLTLPQTIETIQTEGLAAAFPVLASIEVAAGTTAEGDGNGVAGLEGGAAAKGTYSSVAGMLFRSAEGRASSDGEAFADDALELVWAPPAMVVARVPLECKSIASGAFVDASALETVMSFGKMESIAAAEKDEDGNVTKPGAFTDEQISRLTIVVPGTNYAVTSESAERVSGSVALSEKIDMLEKRKTWFHYGFDTEQIIMGAPFGEIEGVIGVDDEGKAEDRSLITPLQNGKGHLDLTPEEQAEVDARKAAEPKDGLSFSYQASMDLSVKWVGDKTATPAHVEIPAYVAIDDVTYQVTQIEPSAFEGAVFLSSVTVPEGVTAIGESAFAGCTNLKKVSLPSTLKTIDYAAFKGTALESVTIPEGATYIGGEAFADCASLEDAQVGASTLVGTNAFAGSPAGAYMQVPTQEGDESLEAEGSQPAGEEEGSDGASMAAYAAPPGVSVFNSTYYSNIPSEIGPVGAWGIRYITSPYYDVYYFGEETKVQPSSGDIPSPATVVRSANGSPLAQNMPTGSTNGHYQTLFQVVTTYGGKTCLEYSSGWHYRKDFGCWQRGTLLFVPKDGVGMGEVRCRQISASAHNRPIGTDASATGYPYWQGTAFYASFGKATNRLTAAPSPEGPITMVAVSTGASLGSSTTLGSHEKVSLAPPAGYSLKKVTVTGEGTTYDAATNILTMGWADSTVSAELIPNDISVTFNLSRGSVGGKTAPGYGNDNVTWGEGDDANTMTIGTVATVGDSNQTTVSFNGQRFTFANGAGQTGCTVEMTPNNGWEHKGDWVLEYKDGENWVQQQELSSVQNATIDYTKQWRLTPKPTGRLYTITYDPNGGVNDVDQWPTPPSSTTQNGGVYTYTDRYTTSVGPTALAEPKRSGFWFAGWKWANAGNMSSASDQGNAEGAWYNGDVADDPAARQFEFPAGAYGNAQLVACWKPKMYEIDYDVTATKATNEAGDPYYMSETPESSYFVHPSARDIIQANATYDEGSKTWSYMGGSDGVGGALHEVDLSCVEAKNLDYTLPDAALDGFACVGWTKDKIDVPGNLPSGADNYYVHTEFSSALANRLWPGSWDTTNKEDVANGTYIPTTNKYTMFGAWTRVGQVNVILGTQQPHEADTAKGGTVTDGLAVKGDLQTIEYWKDRGLFVYDELAHSDHTVQASYRPDELTAGSAAGTVPGAGYVKLDGSKIDGSASAGAQTPQFTPISRTGFRFLGWGTRNTDGTPKDVYIRYYESNGTDTVGDGTAARTTGFYLTPAGMSHVLAWESLDEQNKLDKLGEDEGGYATETWEALWEIRTYDVTLRLPAAAVTTGSIELITSGADPTRYGWHEMSGADAGWYEAQKRWSYWDTIDVPRKNPGDQPYEKRTNFYTYEGWYLTSSAGKGDTGKSSLMVEDAATNRTFRVMESTVTGDDGTKTTVDYGTTGAKTNLLYGGSPHSGEVAITGETVPGAGYGDGAGSTKADGATVLWLNFTPVIINVTAPVGVFLAGDEPYVVGSDPRKHLETEAKFTVRESTHNLVLTGVTATDVKDAVVDEAERNQTSWTAGVTGIETAAEGEAGLCEQMLSVPNQSANASVTGKTAGDRYEDIYNSRVFWVSPTTTVDDYDKASQQTPGTFNTDSRRYFGFGLANDDNKLFDDPNTHGADATKGENDLAAFTLKMPGLTVGGIQQGLTSAADAAAGKALESKMNADNPEYVDFKFYYGLDLRKCDFNLGTIQTMIDNATREAESGVADEASYNDGWQYNQTQKVPLVRLMFTFAVERQDLVSYSARFGSTYDANAANAIAAQQEVPEVTFSGWGA